jgi:hypothetical protein
LRSGHSYLRLWFSHRCDGRFQKAVLRPTLSSCRKLEKLIASLAIPVVRARTLRSPTAVIGTELLAHGEIIEMTCTAHHFERSPVTMSRAQRHTRAYLHHYPRECLKPKTRWRSEMNSNSHATSSHPYGKARGDGSRSLHFSQAGGPLEKRTPTAIPFRRFHRSSGSFTFRSARCTPPLSITLRSKKTDYGFQTC